MGYMKPRRSLTRTSGIRDASIITIACEGVETEPAYFNELKFMYVTFPSRIHVEIIERKDPTLSAPDHVIAMVDKEKKKNGHHPDDQYWMVIDYDRWGEDKISQIARKAYQKDYQLAVSRPCFETWLLLHCIPEDMLNSFKLHDNELEGCKAVESMLRKIRRHYRKDLNDASEYVDQIDIAIRNAKLLDSSLNDRWPQSFGSRVYLLCETIINQTRLS